MKRSLSSTTAMPARLASAQLPVGLLKLPRLPLRTASRVRTLSVSAKSSSTLRFSLRATTLPTPLRLGTKSSPSTIALSLMRRFKRCHSIRKSTMNSNRASKDLSPPTTATTPRRDPAKCLMAVTSRALSGSLPRSRLSTVFLRLSRSRVARLRPSSRLC